MHRIRRPCQFNIFFCQNIFCRGQIAFLLRQRITFFREILFLLRQRIAFFREIAFLLRQSVALQLQILVVQIN